MFNWLSRFFLLEKEQEIAGVLAPFDLNRGFVLTDPNGLIPWRFTADILKSIGNLKVNGDSDFFTWSNQIVFGVLLADVVVSPLYTYETDNQGLKIAQFEIKPKLNSGELFNDVIHVYDFTTQKIAGALGPPHFTCPNQSLAGEELPSLKWAYGTVTVNIGVGERFVDYLRFVVTNKCY